jgi:enoyl-CoA hydratase
MPSDLQQASLDYETIAVERTDDVDWLTLNRPENFNALNARLCAELQDYFSGLCTNHAVRVVIMRGAGRHFCSGYDLDEIEPITGNPPTAMRAQRAVSDIIMLMRRCPQPIVALMHGAAAGGGLALALAADVRYATQDCRMNVAMARIGLTGCDVGISYFLPRAVGASNAAEMMMTGRFVDADKALRIGLVSAVVAGPDLDATARKLADDMLAMSPLGLRFTKEGFNLAQGAGSLEAVITLEDRGQMLCAAAGYMDEGIAAFKEKRPARYIDE